MVRWMVISTHSNSTTLRSKSSMHFTKLWLDAKCRNVATVPGTGCNLQKEAQL